MNWVVVGRKIRETSETELAKGAVARTGADAAVCVLSPTCAVAQIEHVWWDVFELSECAWVACTIPITHTRATQSKPTALTNTPRFADTFSMSIPTTRNLSVWS
jgi:hypothetical protein